MTPHWVVLVDVATGHPVLASVRPSLTEDELAAMEGIWSPLRPPAAEHAHWDWGSKAEAMEEDGVRVVGLEHNGIIQGLARFHDTGHRSRVGPGYGRPLVYVHSVEAAPWNRRDAARRQFRGVGPALLSVAIARSRALGWAGRIGLHSIPRAERFYEDRCGMLRLGPDREYDGLTYFEFTAALADRFDPIGGRL